MELKLYYFFKKKTYLKVPCSFSSIKMIISPGSRPGSWSPSPLNVIFCPSAMPLSMWTSRTFRSLTTLKKLKQNQLCGTYINLSNLLKPAGLNSINTFFPKHVLQRSFALILSPWPVHSPHTDWICWTIPGPICWMRTCIPVPLQLGHRSTAPFFPPKPRISN